MKELEYKHRTINPVARKSDFKSIVTKINVMRIISKMDDNRKSHYLWTVIAGVRLNHLKRRFYWERLFTRITAGSKNKFSNSIRTCVDELGVLDEEYLKSICTCRYSKPNGFWIATITINGIRFKNKSRRKKESVKGLIWQFTIQVNK